LIKVLTWIHSIFLRDCLPVVKVVKKWTT
jgi:hypothetical protein